MADNSRQFKKIQFLFTKYQRHLVLAFRNPLIRQITGSDYMVPEGKTVIGVHPSGLKYLEGDGRITAKFQTRNFIAEQMVPILEKMEISSGERVYSERISEKPYEAFLHYAQLEPKYNVFPQIFLTVSTFISNIADNSIYVGDATYATARNATTGTLRTVTDTFFWFQNSFNAGTTYYIERSFITFATGATIPAGSTISAASLALKTESVANNPAGYTCELVEATPADDTSIVADDYDQVGAVSFGSGTIPAVDTAFTITVNATGQAAIVLGSGNTSWGLRSSGDLNNQTPVADNNVRIRSADHATEADRPTLSVTWTAPETTTSTSSSTSTTSTSTSTSSSTSTTSTSTSTSSSTSTTSTSTSSSTSTTSTSTSSSTSTTITVTSTSSSTTSTSTSSSTSTTSTSTSSSSSTSSSTSTTSTSTSSSTSSSTSTTSTSTSSSSSTSTSSSTSSSTSTSSTTTLDYHFYIDNEGAARNLSFRIDHGDD